MNHTLHLGDCIDVLRELPDNSVAAVVTDPPYGLEFMGKEWDAYDTHGYQRWCELWGEQCLRVLKPGGHALVFGGTRTYHRLASGLEDAGFEIRDTLAWMYGSGFPKSLDVSKAIDARNGAEREVVGTRPAGKGIASGQGNYGGGNSSYAPENAITAPATDDARTWQGWGTALKPAYEPITLARKPLQGTVAANVLAHGTGALNVDGTRIEGAPPSVPQPSFNSPTGMVYGFQAGEGRNGEMSTATGRWPANVTLDPEAAHALDQQTGEIKSPAPYIRTKAVDSNIYGRGRDIPAGHQQDGYGDTGGASRFYYVAKTSRAERNAGLDGFQPAITDDGRNTPIDNPYLRGETTRRNTHPTVKPINLMRWLCRLITPPGGVVLDPFTGSGTTGIACTLEGFNFIGIEREPDYHAIAQARIHWWNEHGEAALEEVRKQEQADQQRQELAAMGQLDLFT